MTRTPEESEAEIERLLTANDRLSRQIIGMSDRLQESARQIAADAWDMGYTSGHSRAMRLMSDEPKVALGVNPYRQPVETFGDDN